MQVKSHIHVKLKGIDSKEAAEALRGKMLLIAPQDQPSLPDDDEFYASELIGMQVGSSPYPALAPSLFIQGERYFGLYLRHCQDIQHLTSLLKDWTQGTQHLNQTHAAVRIIDNFHQPFWMGES